MQLTTDRPSPGKDPDQAVRRCPACEGPMYGWVLASAADPGRHEQYVIDTCADCGHGTTRGDAPPTLPELYTSGAYGVRRHRLLAVFTPVLGAFDRARLRILRRHAPAPASVFEVGAGRGRFLERLVDEGYDATGIEPDGARCAEARDRGVAVEQAAIEEADPGAVDAIVAWHVLEHVEDPAAALEQMAGWLRPGGALVVGVPNRGGWQASLGGAHWFHLDLPRHRHHFTRRSLRVLCERAGLEVAGERHTLAEHGHFGMLQTVLNAVTFHDNVGYGLINRSLTFTTARRRSLLVIDTLITVMVTPLALIVTVPLELLGGLFRRGGAFAVVATTPPEPHRPAAHPALAERFSAPGSRKPFSERGGNGGAALGERLSGLGSREPFSELRGLGGRPRRRVRRVRPRAPSAAGRGP
ncbi:MAG: class I SAM-dependent methyltransferase [Solirubrobacterales bacterium]